MSLKTWAVKPGELKGLSRGAILLFGVAWTYGLTGSTVFTEIAAVFADGLMNGAVLVAIGFLTVGATFKAAAVPFHFWTPDAYQGAPTPITGFLSVGPKLGAFALLLRLFGEALGAVEDAAAHLYVWALKDIPQDLRDALDDARSRETSVPGKRVLETIHRNVNVADSEKNLVCQDTGIAVYHCRVGEGFPLHPARIYEALRDGTARATVEHPLRSNAVHTITRENTGPATWPP